MIAGIMTPTSGEVIVDGVNVKEYSTKDLRNKIAIALQKAELFAGTIKENIKWGKLDATDEDVIEPARWCDLSTLV